MSDVSVLLKRCVGQPVRPPLIPARTGKVIHAELNHRDRFVEKIVPIPMNTFFRRATLVAVATGPRRKMDEVLDGLGAYTPDIDAHTTLMLAGNDRTQHWSRVTDGAPGRHSRTAAIPGRRDAWMINR